MAVKANSDKAKSVVVKVNNVVVDEADLTTKVLAENDVITVVVTAEDSTKTTTYTVTVVK
ncbi:cadherin-like beta sandwich domain-containing protein [Clostridium botulinum]|nr:cadherin-like beta sandwich domain-containing protein [Clostridium botulinum]MCS4524212.1 cadherin-like beta sandwich domain-containing protein [Clostridium botulinum]MCS4526895.1 cadherin-like beta sandwich domain-containing protein [Clostridium botulinum]